MKKLLLVLFTLIFIVQSVYANTAKVQSASENVSKISIMKSYKEVSKITLRSMKEQAKNLSEADKNVIKKYVYGAVRGEDTYLLINCNLRGTLHYYIPKKEITKPLKCRLEYYANALSASVAKTRLPKNIILYRGIDEKGMKLIFRDNNLAAALKEPVNSVNLAVLRKYLVNRTFIEKGFMSTSYDIKSIKHSKFILKIQAPKNIQAVLIEDIGKKSEKEVLINKNSEWMITDIVITTDSATKKEVYMITLKCVVR